MLRFRTTRRAQVSRGDSCTADRSPKTLHRGIEVANDFPQLDFLHVWQSLAEHILSSTKSQIAHKTRDLRASGDEVEIPTRDLFREKLPPSYHVGHGHIVDSTGRVSPQYDIIIAETGAGPGRHRAANGVEYLAYESVYAVGEIRSCYYKSQDPDKDVRGKRNVHEEGSRAGEGPPAKPVILGSS